MPEELSTFQYFGMGIECVKNKDYQKALEYYEKVAKLDPLYRDLWFQIGWVYSSLYNEQKPVEIFDDFYDNPFGESPELDSLSKKIIDSFTKEIENHPDNYEALYNLGLHYQNEIKDNQKAMDCYEKVIAIVPDFSYALNNIAMIYDKSNEKEKAKEFYDKSVLSDPKNEQAWINFAIFSYFQGNFEESMDYYKKSLNLNLSNYDARNSLLGAMESIKRKIKPETDNKNIWIKMGENYTLLSMFNKAIDCYKKVIILEPYNYDMWNKIGEIYLKWNDFNGFMSCFMNIDEIFSELKKITIITTSAGPFNPDVFWFIEGLTGIAIIPSEGQDLDFLEKVQKLPDFNNKAVINAMSCHENNYFVCWEK